MWVDEYWEQFHSFTDNIKNDVIKNIFLHKMQGFWSNFLFGLDENWTIFSSLTLILITI